MLADFRKAFFPTEEEKTRQVELLKKIKQRENDFWKNKGFSKEEIAIIGNIELNEFSELHPYQDYYGRRQSLESGIIKIKQIRDEINQKGGLQS